MSHYTASTKPRPTLLLASLLLCMGCGDSSKPAVGTSVTPDETDTAASETSGMTAEESTQTSMDDSPNSSSSNAPTTAPPTFTVTPSSNPTAPDTSGADASSNDTAPTDTATTPLDASVATITEDHDTGIDAAIPSSCEAPIYLACGDRLAHDTHVQGRADDWTMYSCSAQVYSGRETIYEFTVSSNCGVEVRLGAVDIDLNLFVIKECDSIQAVMCDTGSLPSKVATVNFVATGGHPYFVAVDGLEGAAGAYTLEVDCTCDTDEVTTGDSDVSVTSP